MRFSSNFFSEFSTEFSQLSKSQKWLYFLYAFLLCIDIRGVFHSIESRFGLSSYLDYMDSLVIFVAVIGSIGIFYKKLRLFDIIFLLFIVVYHQFSAVWFPATAQFSKENSLMFLWTCLPMYLVGITIDRKSSPVIFCGISYIAFFLLLYIVVFTGLFSESTGDEIDAISRAYGFLPFCLFLLWYALERGGILNWSVGLFSAFLLVSMGTRGPVVCLVSFIALYIFFFKRFRYNFIVKSLTLICAVIVYFFSSVIAMSFAFIASSLGLSTRVFNQMIEGQMISMESSSNRDVIYSDVLKYLTDHSVYFGEGFYSDRYMTGDGSYVHNIEIEFLCVFGLIGGAILLFLLFMFMIKTFYKSRDSKAFIILLVFFCSSFIGAQFSGSFLSSFTIWLFLGMCVSVNRDKVQTVGMNTYKFLLHSKG